MRLKRYCWFCLYFYLCPKLRSLSGLHEKGVLGMYYGKNRAVVKDGTDVLSSAL